MDMWFYLSVVGAFGLGMLITWPMANHAGYLKANQEARASRETEQIVNQVIKHWGDK